MANVRKVLLAKLKRRTRMIDSPRFTGGLKKLSKIKETKRKAGLVKAKKALRGTKVGRNFKESFVRTGLDKARGILSKARPNFISGLM